MPSEQENLYKIFMPYQFHKQQALKGKKRMVHYTDARAATSIIRNKAVWMRNATGMNDSSEVHHGLGCLISAYNDETAKPMRQLMAELLGEQFKIFENNFNSRMNDMRFSTYLLCVSEHEDDEDGLGRLSMWRAYGRTTRVGLVMKSDVFFNESHALMAFSVPVAYQSQAEFKRDFRQLVERILDQRQSLESVDKSELFSMFFSTFLFFALCTKHPGYREEKEMRVLHCPTIWPSKRLIRDIETVGDAPEVVYKIPLRDIPEEGLSGIEIPALLDHLIIGPTNHNPWATYEAFVSLLRDAGVPNPEAKVRISEIPLRC
jgi:hypothetical protein